MSVLSSYMSRVSGMRFIPNFLNPNDQSRMLDSSLLLHQKIVKAAEKELRRIYVSKEHNLIIEKSYQLLKIDGQFCQHFGNYGENGHALTYFQNNSNIPPFVKELVVDRMEELKEVKNLKSNRKSGLNWKFTFNTYKTIDDQVAGFPFHKDIRSNGDITAIVTLYSSAELQMRKSAHEQPCVSLQLTPGSLFVLSGEARWDWEHRVLPQKIHAVPINDLARISLVVGCN